MRSTGTSDSGGSTRRAVLRTAAGVSVVGLTALAGCSSGNGGNGGGGRFGSYLNDAKANTFEDLRGTSSVTVEVGGGSSGFAFLPTTLEIDPGTTVTFEWVSSGHNVVSKSTPEGASWSGHGSLENKGFTYEHTFETAGEYTYFCEPHEGVGMKGGIAVSDA